METTNSSEIWAEPLPQQLLEAIVVLSENGALPAFLRDVLTEKEIYEIAARFEAAKLLSSGASYDVIQARTKLSTRTIARISLWLKQGAGGYNAALESLSISHSHISPARAE
ncbi:MAG: YerC/YecD family TrpR-related protein [Candidatus Microsaccharimonas sp.]